MQKHPKFPSLDNKVLSYLILVTEQKLHLNLKLKFKNVLIKIKILILKLTNCIEFTEQSRPFHLWLQTHSG